MEKLIEALKEIESNNAIIKKEYLTDGYYKNLHPSVQQAVNLACEELIAADNDSCNWNNIKELKTQGYNVFPGEKDSFGWLTGCIKTSKGIIVYG